MSPRRAEATSWILLAGCWVFPLTGGLVIQEDLAIEIGYVLAAAAVLVGLILPLPSLLRAQPRQGQTRLMAASSRTQVEVVSWFLLAFYDLVTTVLAFLIIFVSEEGDPPIGLLLAGGLIGGLWPAAVLMIIIQKITNWKARRTFRGPR